ncbi:MAG: Fe-S cluster assembly protein SufD, partial [Phycisphaerae bacterium]
SAAAARDRPGPKDLEPFRFGEDAAHLLVFVNGRYAADLSSVSRLPAGVVVCGLAEALRAGQPGLEEHLARHADFQDQAFTALNTAFMEDGALILIPGGTVLDRLVHLLFLSTADGPAAVTHPRNLIVAGAGSQATIVETYAALGDGVYFTNAVTEIVAHDNAVIDHYKVEREGGGAYHVATRQVHQYRDSVVTSHTVSLGGRLVRNDTNAMLDGPGCQCTLNGFYLLKDTQHVDNHLRVDHARPHCSSWEHFKGVLDDRSRAVFTGRIKVYEGAQKTDAKQSNMNLLLSKEALVDTKPQLEILADDVKCTHGATIGQIDPQAVFYLRSRGIPDAAARALLIYAFAGESIGQIRVAGLRDRLQDLVSERLPHGRTLRFGRPYEYRGDYAEHVRTIDKRRET